MRTVAIPPRTPTLRENIRPIGSSTPCGTPTKPTIAPGRAQAIAWFMASPLPTHSSTASAPTPAVSSLMRATPSSPRSSTMSVAPNRRATSWRDACLLIAITRPAPSWDAASTPHSPTAPSPTTTAVPPGRTPAITAACQPVAITSLSVSSAGTIASSGCPGAATKVPPASGTRSSSAWQPSYHWCCTQPLGNPARQCTHTLQEA